MKAFVAAVGGALLALGLATAADAATRVGMLRCQVERGSGYLVGSSHGARCVFTSASGRREHYAGLMKRVGLDIGYTGRAVVTWAVFAPSMAGPHALAGDYAGASADLAAGYGGGANVLVGGNAGTISLQPLSLKTERGFAIGAGAGMLELR
jgi:hypothetical protein